MDGRPLLMGQYLVFTGFKYSGSSALTAFDEDKESQLIKLPGQFADGVFVNSEFQGVAPIIAVEDSGCSRNMQSIIVVGDGCHAHVAANKATPTLLLRS